MNNMLILSVVSISVVYRFSCYVAQKKNSLN